MVCTLQFRVVSTCGWLLRESFAAVLALILERNLHNKCLLGKGLVRGVSRISTNIKDGEFCDNTWQLKAVNNCYKAPYLRCFVGIMDTPLLVFRHFWMITGKIFSFYRFRSLPPSYFRRSDVVILMYDIEEESTFINAKTWIKIIHVSNFFGFYNCILSLNWHKFESVTNAVIFVLSNHLFLYIA